MNESKQLYDVPTVDVLEIAVEGALMKNSTEKGDIINGGWD